VPRVDPTGPLSSPLAGPGAASPFLSFPTRPLSRVSGRLKYRLENVHSAVEAAAVEARRRVRLNEGR
jgi:hypothetical protein